MKRFCYFINGRMIKDKNKKESSDIEMKTFESGNTVLLVLEIGEDINESLEKLSEQYGNKFATISGIGACDLVSLNFYDVKTKKYYEKVLEEDVEMISLMGNLTLKDSKPFAHIHGTFGDDKYQTWSGHVSKAIVSVTAEIVVTFTDMQVSRELNEDVGIYLIP